MQTLRRHRRPVAAILAAAMTVASVPIAPAHAAIVGTDQIIRQVDGSARDRITAFLKRADVKAELEKLGIAPAEAQKRVAALSDEEVAMIAGRIDKLPAGRDAIAAIVGAAVLIFIVLVLTDLLGLTQVFGFTRKGALSPH